MENKNKAILIAALVKAEKNGMKPAGKIRLKNGDAVEADHIYDGYYESIILSVEFAKAFWGEESKEEYVLRHTNCNAIASFNPRYYRYHLQQMVLEENRIAYLEMFL